MFVALNEAGGPKPVPAWTPETETDRALQQYALRLIELGKLMDTEMEARLALLDQAEPDGPTYPPAQAPGFPCAGCHWRRRGRTRTSTR